MQVTDPDTPHRKLLRRGFGAQEGAGSPRRIHRAVGGGLPHFRVRSAGTVLLLQPMLPFLTSVALLIPLATLILTLIATRRFASLYKRVMTIIGATLVALFIGTAIFVFGVVGRATVDRAQAQKEKEQRLAGVVNDAPFTPQTTRFIAGDEKATFEARYVWYTVRDSRTPAELKPLVAKRWFARSEAFWETTREPPALFRRSLVGNIPNKGIWFVMFDRSRSVHIAQHTESGSVVTVISAHPY